MFSSLIERLNDRRDAAGDAEVDSGFTLIELMVVLLILAILLAIAIPTFLGVTGGANDRAAQSNLNTAMTNAKSAASEANQTYGGVTLGQLQTNEPSITWTNRVRLARRARCPSISTPLATVETASSSRRGRRTTAAPAGTRSTTLPP